jgi:lipopolysaccharide assembly outer membrane protein LptD (OstA)
LDWDRKNQTVTTQDIVNIEKENMVTVARGAKSEPNLKKVALEKEVRVDINPAPDTGQGGQVKDKTIITCDGPLEIDYEKKIAAFYNNVKVERPDSLIYSDRMDIYFAASNKEEGTQPQDTAKSDKAPGLMGNKIDKIIARGNVKVVRGENISYSEEATYSAVDKKLILSGKPRLIIYSTEDFKNAPSGS